MQYSHRKKTGEYTGDLPFFGARKGTIPRATRYSWECTGVKICQYATDEVKNATHSSCNAEDIDRWYNRQSQRLFRSSASEGLRQQTLE